MSDNKKKNIVAIVSAIFLFLALRDGWAYDFFTVLRFVVSASCFYIAWLSEKEGNKDWSWIFGGLGILFNPIFIVHLSRGTWVLIDFIVGVLMISSLSFLKFNKKE